MKQFKDHSKEITKEYGEECTLAINLVSTTKKMEEALRIRFEVMCEDSGLVQ